MNPQEPETSSFPAQNSARNPSPPRARSGLAAVLLALLLVAAVALGVWMYNAFLRDEHPDGHPAAQPAGTTVVTVEPSSSAAPAVTPPTTTVTATAEPTPTTPVTTFQASEDMVQCAANVNWRIFRGPDRTSCGFAENVAISMGPHSVSAASQEVTVTSPVTGQNYRMTCHHEGEGSYTCRGGDDALVVLEARHVRD